MHELPALFLAEHRAPRRHRAVGKSNADHVIELAVGVLRHMQHEVGRLGLERRTGRAIAATASAVTRDAALAEDRPPARDGLTRRCRRVLELRCRVETAGPVALLRVRPPGRNDRAGSDERRQRPPRQAVRRPVYAVRLRARERRRSTNAPTIVISTTAPPITNAGSIVGSCMPAGAGAADGFGVTGAAEITCTRTPLRFSGDWSVAIPILPVVPSSGTVNS